MAEAPYHSLSAFGEDYEEEDVLTFDSSFCYWPPTRCSDHGFLTSNYRGMPVVEEEEYVGGSSFDLEFPERTSLRSGSDPIVGSEITDRENQVHFVIDLLQQRVEQSRRSVVEGSEFGVVEGITEEVGLNSVEFDVGELSGLGFDAEANSVVTGRGSGGDDRAEFLGGVIISDCRDEFFIARRDSENGNRETLPCNGETERRQNGFWAGVNVIDYESDLDDDVNEMVGLDCHFEEEDEDDYAAEDVNEQGMSIPLRWNSLVLDDNSRGSNIDDNNRSNNIDDNNRGSNIDDNRGSNNDEFEWEEVDSRMETMSNTVDFTEVEDSFSVFPIRALEDDDEEEEEEEYGERGSSGGLGNVEWGVLINVSNNIEMENEDDEPYFGDHDDHLYEAEYETIFDQFVDGENASTGRPPASKLAVNNLPSVAVTAEDVKNGTTICAVCKDEMDVGEGAKQLPCTHRYHGDCIVPWLCIRNTCPVCRYELPTDDPDYERRIRRAARAV